MIGSRSLTLVTAYALGVLAMGVGSAAHAGGDRETFFAASSQVAPTITLKASTSEYHSAAQAAGETVSPLQLTGKARALAGTTLKIERRLDGTQQWAGTGRVYVQRNGRFTFNDDPHTLGVRFYRAVGQQGAVSAQVKVDVWLWSRLAYRIGPRDNFLVGGTSFNNMYRYDSLLQKEAGKPAFAEFTVSGVCKLATAVVALNDTSIVGSTGSVSVSKDGTKVLDRSLNIGEGERITVDISGAQRVRFDVETSATPAGIAGIGEPLVLCH